MKILRSLLLSALMSFAYVVPAAWAAEPPAAPQQQASLYQRALGGCTGRDMKTVHTGLNITESDWDSTVKYLVGTLDKFKVPEKEKNEVLTALAGLKGDIVGH